MSGRRASLIGGLLLLVLVAVNLRPAIVAVGPLLTDIQKDFHLSGTAAGALTTLPLAFFGVYGLVTPFLRRQPRSETLLVAAMTLLVVALLGRVLDAPAALFAGSLVAGVAISLGNIAIPTLIKRDHPDSITLVTSIYTVAITSSAALSAAVVIPLRDATGGGWRPPLALLAVPAALAGLAWLPRLLRAPAAPAPAAPAPVPVPAPAVPVASGEDEPAAPAPSRRAAAAAVWRSGLAWQVTFFMGLQSLLAYVTTGWLATICLDRGMSAASAGYVLALSNLLQAGGSLAVPFLARRMRDQRPLVLIAATLTIAGFAGVTWAPLGSVWVGSAVLGFGQGVGFATALSFIGLRAHDARVAAQLSGMAQGCGYLIAALGPLAVGALYDATHGWNVPIAAVLVAAAALLIPGLAAGRNRTVRAPAAPSPAAPATVRR
ncbi:CynX/NimT family MFS transporter [Actinomadura viridis]|uniref:CP family cyanate transporter-like MFS transporter n=1 Tax=Actinomadura viridis TaxID=58110 RepID=A0A931DNQ6_9ACTN|nr:MFS transporter [Actinomadura viridis]MBG6093310.1 CP family cyanate transporter-like MFS transporter [Actinomadura viridis]